MTNEHHLEAFWAGIQEAWESTQKIQEHLGNHCGIDKNDIRAGHVANVRHVCAILNDVKTFLGIHDEQ